MGEFNNYHVSFMEKIDINTHSCLRVVESVRASSPSKAVEIAFDNLNDKDKGKTDAAVCYCSNKLKIWFDFVI